MGKTFHYHVAPDPDGDGWMVMAKGHVARSLPYDTKAQAIEITEELVRRHPGSTLAVDEHPPLLTSIEIEHRLTP